MIDKVDTIENKISYLPSPIREIMLITILSGRPKGLTCEPMSNVPFYFPTKKFFGIT